MAHPFYDSKVWQRKRRFILARDRYQCQISKRYGKMLEADTVHHIFPRDVFPEYSLADWNLIAVNHTVHDQLHDRTTRKLTEKGMDLLRRTARINGIEFDDDRL